METVTRLKAIAPRWKTSLSRGPSAPSPTPSAPCLSPRPGLLHEPLRRVSRRHSPAILPHSYMVTVHVHPAALDCITRVFSKGRLRSPGIAPADLDAAARGPSTGASSPRTRTGSRPRRRSTSMRLRPRRRAGKPPPQRERSGSLRVRARRGGLLLIGGWSADLPPYSFIDYYESVAAKVGEGKTRDSVMPFMVPAMSHCAWARITPSADHELRCRRLRQALEGDRKGARAKKKTAHGEKRRGHEA
jgi:hypothetical protein